MLFSHSHEWVKKEEEKALIGISRYARQELGEIVYIELPRLGQTIYAKEPMAVVESTKAATDIYAPISGGVVAVNQALQDQPELLNEDPENTGWFVEIELKDETELKDLLSDSEYANLVGFSG